MPFFRNSYPSRRSVSHYKHYYPAHYTLPSHNRDYYVLPPMYATSLPTSSTSSSSSSSPSKHSSSSSMTSFQTVMIVLVAIALVAYFNKK